MTRTKLMLCATCMLSLIGATTYVWSQSGDDPSYSESPGVRTRAKPRGNLSDRNPNDARRGVELRALGVPGIPGAPNRPGMFLNTIESRPQGRTRRRVVTETARVERVIEVPVSEEELQTMKEFQNALSVLKESKDEAARKKATETIQTQLVKQFEQDLKQRQQELTTIEERVTSLRQQLEKRKSSQADIISLRLKTIINNADGLGFPGDPDAEDSSLSFADPTDFEHADDVLMIRAGKTQEGEMRGNPFLPTRTIRTEEEVR